MKRLILLRHAKSSWESDAVNDHSRPLNERGRTEAPLLGPRLNEAGWVPERVLCSDAMRARQTWELAQGALNPRPAYELEPRLYLAGPHQLRDVLSEVPDEVATLLLVGHNPGWEEAIDWFSGRDTRLKTSTAALLAAKTESPWPALVEQRGSFRFVDLLRAVPHEEEPA